MLIKGTKEDFDRKLQALRTDVASLSSRMEDHGGKEDGQFEVDRLNKLSQNFGLFKNLNNRLTQMEVATASIDRTLKQIQKMERQVDEQDGAIEQIEQQHKGLQKVVQEVQKAHAGDLVPRIEKLESDIDVHQKTFTQLKDQDLHQIRQRLDREEQDISRLNDENIQFLVQLDKSENMQKEMGKAIVKNRNEIDEHRKKINYLSD